MENELIYVFRVDASREIGTGHLMRCFNLGETFQQNGSEVHFICRDLGFPLAELFQNRNFKLHLLAQPGSNRPFEKENYDADETIEYLKSLPTKCEWLIVDHYNIEASWEALLRPYCQRLLVIDDLANRHHHCNILLDQNYYENGAKRYEQWVNKDCIQLLGPNYILLQDKFKRSMIDARIRQSVSAILINFGGIDLPNETLKALHAALQSSKEVAIHVVVGTSCPHKSEIEALCAQFSQCHYYCQTSKLDELVSQADLAIGAGGVSLWERIALGLPSIVTSIADNQRQILEDVSNTQCIHYLGSASQVSIETYLEAIRQYMNNPESLEAMSERCMDWIDGQGCERVLIEMKKESQNAA